MKKQTPHKPLPKSVKWLWGIVFAPFALLLLLLLLTAAGLFGRLPSFEELENPKSNLASMGIYIFNFSVLRDALIKLKDQSNCDFGKHIIPYCFENGKRLFAYEYNGYWKDVGTLGSYSGI